MLGNGIIARSHNDHESAVGINRCNQIKFNFVILSNRRGHIGAGTASSPLRCGKAKLEF